MTQFADVFPPLAQALTDRGYSELTPVQQAMLAPELDGADALVSAQTGSGKTVAFGLALAPTLLGKSETFGRAETPLALIVAPTRELALQVKRELQWLYEPTGAQIASCVGGMDMRTERRALDRGAHMVVGTPGRLKDHIMRRSLDLSGVRAVVLDEADEMLDLGFREDLEFILGSAPPQRRTLMFSATVPRAIADLAKSYQRDAVRVQTTEERDQHVDIEYRALTVAPQEREHAIINVLRYYEAKNALVFCGTRAMVNHLTARFNNRGFSVVALSGELSQNERSHALQAMRDGRARVCIATDVAARGIDLPGLELVIHADLPSNSETLLHRSGRTGRAGNKGVSVVIVPRNFRRKAERLLNGAGIEATWAAPPSADDVITRDNERLKADPMLSEPINQTEEPLVAQLVDTHSPAQLAAAFVRLYRDRSSAPEELNDQPLDTSKPSGDDFADSVWISLSVGRDRKAEPRWLLPLLCRAGDITKREIGAIRVQSEETHVQLTARCFEGFIKAIGPDAQLEDKITVSRMDDPKGEARERPKPRPTRQAPEARRDRPRRRPHRDNDYTPEPDKAPDPEARAKPERKPRPPSKPRPEGKRLKQSDGSKRPRKSKDKHSKRKGKRSVERGGDAPVRRKSAKPASGAKSTKKSPHKPKPKRAAPAASRDPSVSLRKRRAKPKR